ncbi:uncharacterized protein BJ171DRAFT_615992 [Polychytrium aggregatum]|uniref:uncharacterized protein n=1 Tax=Polychytrium aggregatum TaxID=110093 RepID=UPI0022FE130C|nr:uncharacterized protein BJ171DRAFT_615992 [Polychytrium aggregatum]KAI9205359.1 hypothetical protein BJ171DRAFT_615992 [Polychytrium aggregatum]
MMLSQLQSTAARRLVLGKLPWSPLSPRHKSSATVVGQSKPSVIRIPTRKVSLSDVEGELLIFEHNNGRFWKFQYISALFQCALMLTCGAFAYREFNFGEKFMSWPCWQGSLRAPRLRSHIQLDRLVVLETSSGADSRTLLDGIAPTQSQLASLTFPFASRAQKKDSAMPRFFEKFSLSGDVPYWMKTYVPPSFMAFGVCFLGFVHLSASRYVRTAYIRNKGSEILLETSNLVGKKLHVADAYKVSIREKIVTNQGKSRTEGAVSSEAPWYLRPFHQHRSTYVVLHTDQQRLLKFKMDRSGNFVRPEFFDAMFFKP